MSLVKAYILEPIEALVFLCFFTLLKILPISVASWLIGKTARWVGPFLPAHQIGLKNVARAFPEKSALDQREIVKQAWETLGRTIGEFPHIEKLVAEGKHIEVVNGELINTLREDGKGGIFFAAHLGNWEIPHFLVIQHQMPIYLIFRPPNNRILYYFLKKVRDNPRVHMIPKGAGSIELLRVLKNNQHVGVLMDQRFAEGEKLSFFGQPAFSATGPAKLAHKLNLPLVPVQVKRKKRGKFQVIFHSPISREKTPEETTQKINDIFEEWIRQEPGQWLWLHNRWRL